MPIYAYICANCIKAYDYFHLGADDKIPECPYCGSHDAEKQPPKNTSLSFKGHGFYVTDYKKSRKK